MKQFTTEEQTKLLRSVGCPEPKGTALTEESKYALMPELEPNYSLGELIEALKELTAKKSKETSEFSIESSPAGLWIVNANKRHTLHEELIDALFMTYMDLKADYVESKHGVC